MSHVTDILLITALDDGVEHQHKPLNAELLNAYLEARHQCSLFPVEQYAGGNKKMQCSVFMAAINYLNIADFIQHFYTINWQYPESVQLMLKDENDDLFAVYQPTSL